MNKLDEITWIKEHNKNAFEEHNILEIQESKEIVVVEKEEYDKLKKQLEDIRNYIIQSDLDKMLWGKELMKILDREAKC